MSRNGRQALAWDNRPLSGKRGEPARRMTFMLTDDDHAQLTAIAEVRGVRLAAAIRLLINEETDRVAADST